MNLLDREVHFGKGRTVILLVHWTIFGTVLLSGLTLSYIDEYVWAALIGGPLAIMIFPPFKRDADRQLPSWKYIVQVSLLAGALTWGIGYIT